MPGTEEAGLSIGNVADLLAFSPTLPRGNPNYSSFKEIQDEAIERQGETEPMLWAAAAILLVIAGGLAWEEIRKR